MSAQDAGKPLGNNGGVCAVWVLALPEDIEIAQPDAAKAIGRSKDRAAGRQIPDIALHELEVFPGFVAYGRLNQVQVFTVASGKIIQADYPLSRVQ
jgi:hypothetical protein